jgi:hypothetical protein
MSKNVTALAVSQFDTMIKAEYQAGGFLLDNTTQQRRNVKGETATFNLIAQGIAQEKISQDDVPLMNPTYSKTVATLKNYTAADLTDIFDQQEVLFDDQKALAKTAGMAIGRRKDQIIINAANTSTTTNVIAEGGANFTYQKFLEGVAFLNKSRVSRRTGKRYCVITTDAETSLMNETEFTSNDFVRNAVLNNLGLDQQNVMGVEFIVIPDMEEGGIPETSNIQTCFMWHEFALGFATGVDFRTEINYLPQKTSYLVNAIFKGACVEVDPKGIVKVNIDKTK